MEDFDKDCRSASMKMFFMYKLGYDEALDKWLHICHFQGRFTHSAPCPCRAHALPLPCRAVSRRPCCAVALRRTAWSEHGMGMA